MLAKCMERSQRDWSGHVSYVTFAYNCSVHSSTGQAPIVVMTGRQPLWNLDLLLSDIDESDYTVPEYTYSVIDGLRLCHEIVREQSKCAVDRMSEGFNSHVNPSSFRPEDVVRVYNPRKEIGKSSKWQLHFSDTAKIVKKLNDVTYIVKGPWKENKIIHVDKLKLVKQFNN